MYIIKNGYIIDPDSGREGYADLRIDNERIEDICWIDTNGPIDISKLEQTIQVIDVTGCIVAPGLVDVHVHFRDPGFTHKEDICTGAKAAAKGGYTDVILMANTNPVVDNMETLEYVLKKGADTPIHVHTCSAITKGLKGKELVDMEALCKGGVSGFTDDGIPLMDESILREAMIESARLNKVISLHEEDASLISQNGINREIARSHFGIEGSPREAESTLVKRDITLAIETNAILNVQHISTKEAVDHVREAIAESNQLGKLRRIHAEATPHHFSLTQEAILQHGTLAKMNPPLREEADRCAIIEGLKDGTIDVIATDHAPHTKEEKDKPFSQAPSGILGLETALSLGITYLVKTGHMTHKTLLEKMSTNPANMYGLANGKITKNGPADLVIYHPDETHVIDGFCSKSQNSPFIGETLWGVVHYTICKGKIIYNKSLGESCKHDK